MTIAAIATAFSTIAPFTKCIGQAIAAAPLSLMGLALGSISLDAQAAGLTPSSSQYVQEISLDMCNWANRPVQSMCTTQNLSSSSGGGNIVPCADPTEAPPSTSWFELSPTVPAPYDSHTGRQTQQWHWLDGRYLSGLGAPVIHCPTSPAQWGSLLFTKPLATTQSGHVFLRVPGFLSHHQARYVRGQVKVYLYSQRPLGPPYLPGIDLSATLALQTLGMDNVWRDAATMVLPAPDTYSGGGYEFFEIETLIQPYTPVRVELRANALPPLRFADPDYIWGNYHLGADIIEARLILPDCIPDQSQPGFCL